MNYVLLSLGSNLGDRIMNLHEAVQLIHKRIGDIITHSPYYESKSWGINSPNDYINICIKVETQLNPFELIEEIQNIENELGRVRQIKYGDRTIDIDILLYNEDVVDSDELKIPHPHMHERLFVLVPANQIAPYNLHPIFNKTIQQLLLDCDDETNVYEYKISPEKEL